MPEKESNAFKPAVGFWSGGGSGATALMDRGATGVVQAATVSARGGGAGGAGARCGVVAIAIEWNAEAAAGRDVQQLVAGNLVRRNNLEYLYVLLC